MCIVSIAWNCHPKWKLVVAGNRDELHARPSQALARWQEDPALLAGRDQIAGGTWLGVSEQGRLAVITNVAGTRQPNAELESRGLLLRDFLRGTGSHAKIDLSNFPNFGAFNLFTVERGKASLYSNRGVQPRLAVDSGIHGLSNGTLDQPWPKAARLNEMLSHWLASDRHEHELLMTHLGDETPCPFAGDGHLDDSERTGHEQSPIFIRNSIYGTRCSSVILIDNEGQGLFAERRFDSEGHSVGENEFKFNWPMAPN